MSLNARKKKERQKISRWENSSSTCRCSRSRDWEWGWENCFWPRMALTLVQLHKQWKSIRVLQHIAARFHRSKRKTREQREIIQAYCRFDIYAWCHIHVHYSASTRTSILVVVAVVAVLFWEGRDRRMRVIIESSLKTSILSNLQWKTICCRERWNDS